MGGEIRTVRSRKGPGSCTSWRVMGARIVENFIAAALGRRITKTYLPVTFARNFGYFEDQRGYRTFSFQTKDRDLQARVGEMASEVLRTAHAVWHRHTDLRAVADSLEAVATGPYLTRAPRIAVARFLLGTVMGWHEPWTGDSRKPNETGRNWVKSSDSLQHSLKDASRKDDHWSCRSSRVPIAGIP